MKTHLHAVLLTVVSRAIMKCHSIMFVPPPSPPFCHRWVTVGRGGVMVLPPAPTGANLGTRPVQHAEARQSGVFLCVSVYYTIKYIYWVALRLTSLSS